MTCTDLTVLTGVQKTILQSLKHVLTAPTETDQIQRIELIRVENRFSYHIFLNKMFNFRHICINITKCGAFLSPLASQPNT